MTIIQIILGSSCVSSKFSLFQAKHPQLFELLLMFQTFYHPSSLGMDTLLLVKMAHNIALADVA